MKIGQTKTFGRISIKYGENYTNPNLVFWEVSAIRNKKINKKLERCHGYIEMDNRGPTFSTFEFLCIDNNSIFYSQRRHTIERMKVLKEFVEDIEKAMLFVKNEWDCGRV